MKVIVNRKALDEAIQKIINEKSTESARIDTIAGQVAAEEEAGGCGLVVGSPTRNRWHSA